MKKILIIALIVAVLLLFLSFKLNNVVAPIADMTKQLKPGPMVIIPDPLVIAKEIQHLAKLETASLYLTRTLRVEKDNNRLWGIFGERLIFVANGEVTAGVDLSQLQENQIQVIDQTTIYIQLPEAEIFTVSLDNNNSYIASREKGILAVSDSQLETRTRRRAQQEIEKAALESNLLDTANQSAQDDIRSLLKKLGFVNIKFI